jgi:hypothetical protein
MLGNFYPLMQEQGLTIDMAALIQVRARYKQLPELLDIVRDGKGAWREQLATVGQRPGKPGPTAAPPPNAPSAGLMGQQAQAPEPGVEAI